MRYYHTCGTYCDDDPDHKPGTAMFPWYKPGSYSAFWKINGYRIYWPAMITVWHVEPDGKDSGEICKHYTRTEVHPGEFVTKHTGGWRWHIHHWRIQVPPLQHLRRRLLTRCEKCGGKDRKANPVNISNQWERPHDKWWRGERGLYHHRCEGDLTPAPWPPPRGDS